MAAAKPQPALVQAMQQALALYSARDWVQAEQVCRSVLAAQANNFDALNLLGIMAAQTQRLPEAAELFDRGEKHDERRPHRTDLLFDPRAELILRGCIELSRRRIVAHGGLRARAARGS